MDKLRANRKHSIICLLILSVFLTACSKNNETSKTEGEMPEPTFVTKAEDSKAVSPEDAAVTESDQGSSDAQSTTEQDTNPSNLSGNENDVVGVVKSVSKSVVSINVTSSLQDASTNKSAPNAGAGSGFIIKEDQTKIYIATNHHVVKDANSITVSMDNEKEIKATFLGGEAQSDLAVIVVTKKAFEDVGLSNYAPATLGDSEAVEVGEYVVAIGNALGEGKTVTDGIVSAKNKDINIDDLKLKVMQTNAAINQGNSGGPLANMKGEIIGINTAKLSTEGVEGMGYSIPINSAKTVIDNIMKNPTQTPPKSVNKTDAKPSLGVKGITVSADVMSQNNFQSEGVYVAGTVKNSGAEAAGLKKGDIIVAIEKVTITSVEELQTEIKKYKSGDIVKIYYYRKGLTKPERVNLTL
jgi:serine protease Do